MKLYVEGGGDSNALRTSCRKGFSDFLKKAGLGGKMPRIVACGSRKNAYDSFCTAIELGEAACLLVDSEDPVLADHQRGDDSSAWLPWDHLHRRQGDHWPHPPGAEGIQCHLMVQCMESWLLTDRATLQAFWGQDFNSNALPDVASPIEAIDKERVYRALVAATRYCRTKSKYDKGENSFELLGIIDPSKVKKASPWARRFIDYLLDEMGG